MINLNEYFEGSVKSLGYRSSEGKSTIGVMEKGEYEFGTSTHETMIIIEGSLQVLLPGETVLKHFGKGEQFEVPAHVCFKVVADQQTSYLCKYQDI